MGRLRIGLEIPPTGSIEVFSLQTKKKLHYEETFLAVVVEDLETFGQCLGVFESVKRPTIGRVYACVEANGGHL